MDANTVRSHVPRSSVAISASGLATLGIVRVLAFGQVREGREGADFTAGLRTACDAAVTQGATLIMVSPRTSTSSRSFEAKRGKPTVDLSVEKRGLKGSELSRRR